MKIFIVLIGGFFGSICRYMVSGWFPSHSGFPIATMLINIVGCFLLGWLLTTLKSNKNKHLFISLLFGTGFISSFTTFSTFTIETIQLLEDQLYIFAIVYVCASILLGILAAYIGYKLVAFKVGENR